MKATTLGVLMGAALFAACFVDRPSRAFECTTTADCAELDDHRTCKSGYCVVQNCPTGCDSCDETARTCAITCTTADRCGSVLCPSGWSCTIDCVGDMACGSISCASASRCAVVCTGTGACGSVSCADACKCDLTCTTGACGTPDCPVVGNGANAVHCTVDGTDTGTCDSAHDAGCTKC